MSTSTKPRARKSPPKIVAVVWLDAVANSGWTDHDEAPEPVEIHSVGWLVRRTKTGITIATSIGGSEHNGSMTIPRGMIRSIVEVA